MKYFFYPVQTERMLGINNINFTSFSNNCYISIDPRNLEKKINYVFLCYTENT